MKGRGKPWIPLTVLIFFVVLLLWPHTMIIPVRGGTIHDWNRESFWFHPWGASIVHHGIDIFGPRGREILASTGGLVLYAGDIRRGGRVVALFGPGLRIHYYAHLSEIRAESLQFVSQGETIGLLGQSGNAQSSAPHLHYSIVSLVPIPWRWDTRARLGWKKMFYLNPDEELRKRSGGFLFTAE